LEPKIPGSLRSDRPYVSSNVWNAIVEAYLQRDRPTVFEWGTGASSIHHLENLVSLGGTYIGVEHDRNWYGRVVSAIVDWSLRCGYEVTLSGSLGGCAHIETTIRQHDGRGCEAHLLLRPPVTSYEGDGDLASFSTYVAALDRHVDVVIVDGRARRACVDRVLDEKLVRPGGLLALLDAGRGLERWLGYPTQLDTSDYQPAVHRMLGGGGWMVNGSGIDRWPEDQTRRSFHPKSYFVPSEACLLRF